MDFYALKSEMDRQHVKLEKMLELLESQQHTKDCKETFSDVLNAMSEYAIEHFKFEESAMRFTNYPNLTPHRDAHRKFLKKTIKFCMEKPFSSNSATEEAIQYLRTWLHHHFEHEDKEMEDFLAQQLATSSVDIC